MRMRLLLAVPALLCLAAGAHGGPKPAAQKECPVTDFKSEAIEEALRTAESCVKAREVFTACAYGAGGDVAFGQAVIEVCEKEFAPKLKPLARKGYDRLIKRCWGKHRRDSGTMYRSLEAMCAADVAVSYAKRSARAKPRGATPR